MTSMIANPQFFSISAEDYLAGEQVSPIKHEYCRGQVYAMVGAKKPHVLLASNLTRLLGNHLIDQPCLVMASDIKVRLETADCYYYPDVVVTCDPKDLEGIEDCIYAPKLVIEILSKSTAKFDKGEKFIDYQTCPSLEEYVLVSQEKRSLEVRSLMDGMWKIANYEEGDRVVLHSVGWSAEVAEIYRKVPIVPESM
jgi:Uma2 family endonuclease